MQKFFVLILEVSEHILNQKNFRKKISKKNSILDFGPYLRFYREKSTLNQVVNECPKKIVWTTSCAIKAFLWIRISFFSIWYFFFIQSSTYTIYILWAVSCYISPLTVLNRLLTVNNDLGDLFPDFYRWFLYAIYIPPFLFRHGS